MSSLDNFGISAQGISIPRQADFTNALQAQWQASFGNNVNLDPRSNNGQIINIMAERFALLAELLEGIYNAGYPAGAEGVAVDNLLALQGLTRLAASPSRTAQSPVVLANGVTLYGLVCYGTPGTTIPAGSLISDSAQPSHTFRTDSAIAIQSAQNAVQSLVLSTTPTSGTFSLTLSSLSGATYTTPALPPSIAARRVALNFSGTPADQYGSFTLQVGTYGTLSLTASSPLGVLTGAQLAALINSTYNLSTVSGSGNSQVGVGISLDFGAMAIPALTAGGGYPPSITPSLQSVVNGITDATTGKMPFTDVAVSRNGNTFTLAYGSNAVAQGQPSTAAQAIPAVQVSQNSLVAGSSVVNVSVANSVAGQPAQAVASATCTQTGPNSVTAGQLTQILTPISGWDSVTNQLDCTPGTDAETDTAALARRQSLVASQAQGPLASIVQRVREVPGVTTALALTNDSMASQQIIQVASGATSGTFTLVLAGQTTSPLPYNATVPQVQAAIRALSGTATATVAGAAGSGLYISWGTSAGGQAVPLLSVGSNSTGVSVTTQFGRYPKSVELVVDGGSNADVAQAIFSAAPAGLATYGQTVQRTLATTAAGSAAITVQDVTNIVVGLGVECLGVPAGAIVQVLDGNTVTLSVACLSTYSNATATFLYAQPIADANGNLQIVRFSRPTQVPIYARCVLVTDQYVVPGDSSTGINPAAKWSVTSVSDIQDAIVAAVNAVGVGGQLIATGSNGIANSFRSVPGIDDASVYFGYSADTTNQGRLQLAAEQLARLEKANVVVSFT